MSTAARPGTSTSRFYMCMSPPWKVCSLNVRMRIQDRRSLSFSSSRCMEKSHRFTVAFDASAVIKNSQGQQQSSNLEIPYKSVLRRLILLRHAESSRGNRSLRDHDRPLSSTGQADAVKVSQKLHLLGWIPELILSSDAQRTRETLRIMQEEVQGFSDAEVHFLSSFYSVAAMDGQTAEHLQQSICEYSGDEILTVMCMGHNKGWEEAASLLSGVSVELKTCNAALLEATGNSWEEVRHLKWKILLKNLANFDHFSSHPVCSHLALGKDNSSSVRDELGALLPEKLISISAWHFLWQELVGGSSLTL